MQIDRKFFLIKFFCSIVIAFPAAQPCCAGTAEVTAVHTLGSGRRRYRELHNLVSDHVIISAENRAYNVTLSSWASALLLSGDFLPAGVSAHTSVPSSSSLPRLAPGSPGTRPRARQMAKSPLSSCLDSAVNG